MASGHVIYTFLGEAFWLSDPILCLFVVGIMQTKISSVIIRFILFFTLVWILLMSSDLQSFGRIEDIRISLAVGCSFM